MKDLSNAVRLPLDDEFIAPVTIFDAHGQFVQVVDGTEFRRTHPRLATSRYPAPAIRRRRGGEQPTS